VFEPDSYGPVRFALQEDGEIIKLTAAGLATRLVDEGKSMIPK